MNNLKEDYGQIDNSECVLFVTFLWQLSRESVPSLRSWDEYKRRLGVLLQTNPTRHFVVFADDQDILVEARKYPNVRVVQESPKNFLEWKQERRLDVKNALRKKPLRLLFNNPELHSEEYVCMQNIKFEAVSRALSIWPHRFACWIDAGLREEASPRQFRHSWNADDTRIRVGLYNPIGRSERFILETPGSSVIGTVWGGGRHEMVWLFEQSYRLQTSLLQQGKCANDQQLLTLLVQQHARQFLVFSLFSYGIIPFFGSGRWKHVLHILDDKNVQMLEPCADWKPFARLLAAVVVILAFYLLLSAALPFSTVNS